MKKQESLHDALIPTLVTLFEAPADSPLREVKQETVLKYVIGATRPVFCSNGLNLHNTLGLKLLELMNENLESKEIHKVFAKELLLLEIGDDPLLKKDMVAKVDALLGGITVDLRTKKNITDFRDMLKGCYKAPLKFSSTGVTTTTGIEGESEDEEEEEKIALDEVMDVSLSKVEMKELDVNVTKLGLSKIQEEDDAMEADDKSLIASCNVSQESVDVSHMTNKSEAPDVQGPSRVPADESHITNKSRVTRNSRAVAEDSTSVTADDSVNEQSSSKPSTPVTVSRVTRKARAAVDDSSASADNSQITNKNNSPLKASRPTRAARAAVNDTAASANESIESSQSTNKSRSDVKASHVKKTTRAPVEDSSSSDNDESRITSDDTQVPDTQDPTAASTQESVASQASFEIAATQSENSDSETSDDEVNNTVVEATEDEMIPATPDAPVGPKRNFTNKRQLDVSKSVSSPLRKHQKSDDSAPTTPKTPKAHSTMISPKTPRFSSLPNSKASTPNTDRHTRKQAREEVATTSKLTRSASKKMNVDPVEIAEKVVTKASKVTVKAAEVLVKKTAPVKEKEIATKRSTRGNANQAKGAASAKDSKPRWR
jgi:Nuclear condensing complex subunits, C-term domain